MIRYLECPTNWDWDRCSSKEYGLKCNTCVHGKQNNVIKMDIQEFDDSTMVILNEMRKQYKSMTSGDIQTVVVFAKMFKDKYAKYQMEV